MYYYSSVVEQIKMLFKKKILPVQKRYQNSNENIISDIKDGSYYKDFIRSHHNNENIYSFMVNTDGISLCDKSNLSIWPVYLAINELEQGDRYQMDNVLLSGVCVGYSKPLIKEFLIPIKNELLELEIGINLENKW